jgi:hypothetical protein
MNPPPNDLLLLAGKVLALIAKWAMAIAALALIICIPLIILFQRTITDELRIEMADPNLVFPVWQATAALSLALVAVGLLYTFFDRLVRIIGTVGDGDPFAPANADRLSQMGWLMLAVQLVAIPLAGLGLFLAKTFEEQGGTIDAGVDVGAMLLVVILFILARVFRHGAAMREDLEGTV